MHTITLFSLTMPIRNDIYVAKCQHMGIEPGTSTIPLQADI